MTQCHLGRRFSALPRRDIIITSTAKAESSFAGTGRGGPGRRKPLVDRLLGRAAPQETGCPISGRIAVARRDRQSNPRYPEAFDRCLREWPNPLYFWTAVFERQGLKLMAAAPVSRGVWPEGR